MWTVLILGFLYFWKGSSYEYMNNPEIVLNTCADVQPDLVLIELQLYF